MPIRVAIFEDNKLVRDSFEAILNGNRRRGCNWTACCGSFSWGGGAEGGLMPAILDKKAGSRASTV